MVKSWFKTSSLVAIALFTTVAAAFAWQLDWDKPGGELVPICCILVIAAAVVSEALRLRKNGNPDLDWTGAGLVGYILFGCFVLLVRYLGFVVATPVFVTAIFVITQPDKPRALVRGLILGVCLSAALYGIFVVAMGNLLPMGIFE